MSELTKRIAALSPNKRELLLQRLQHTRGASANPAPALGGTAMSIEAMKAEAILDPAIDPTTAAPVAVDPATILLTGATGFLGAFLLHELLQQTRARIFCLARAASPEEARRRIAANLAAYQLPADNERIVPLVGDLSRPLLGLEPRQFQQLAEEIDLIHHCGAVVRWTYPYPAVRAANVAGTQEILRLACMTRVKPVHFISSVGVFSSPHFKREEVLETDSLEGGGPLYLGYAQSKWISEMMVRSAGARGLPVSIYRPNTSGHSQTGVQNLNDYAYLLMKGCIELGCAPDLDLTIRGAPIDFVSQAIVYLATQPKSVGQTFHLVSPDGVRWNDLADWLRGAGYRMPSVSYADWVEALKGAVKGSRSKTLVAFSPFFTEAMLTQVQLPRFDTRNTFAALAGTPFVCPPTDAALLTTYFAYLVGNGHLEAPPDAG